MKPLLLIVLLLLIGLLIVRRRNAKPDNSAKASSSRALPQRAKVAKKSTPYHAVSIRTGPRACEAAKELQGKRFLSGAAPHLPLSMCDAADCSCRFVHHADRRAGSDRRSEIPRGFGGAETGQIELERRRRPERRHDEDDMF